MKNNIKDLILDTDILNEIDDQFALTYLICLLKKYKDYKLHAITIAPFDPSFYLKINDKNYAMIQSKLEAEKILEMLNYKCDVLIGCNDYIDYLGNNYNNIAVDRIIKTAKKVNKLKIIAIGCLTNIAFAILKQPDISSKLDITWLGGNSLDYISNVEFNLKQDSKAVNIVLQSDATITIIPARPVASSLILTKEIAKKYFYNKSKLGDYLYNLLVNFSLIDYKKRDICVGSTMWDISCVYDTFFRSYAIKQIKLNKFVKPIVYKTNIGLTIDDNLNWVKTNGSNVNMVVYMDPQKIMNNFVTTIRSELKKKNN